MIQIVGDDVRWVLSFDDFRLKIGKRRDTGVGPDLVTYSAWRNSPDKFIEALYGAYLGLLVTEVPGDDFNLAYIWCSLKSAVMTMTRLIQLSGRLPRHAQFLSPTLTISIQCHSRWREGKDGCPMVSQHPGALRRCTPNHAVGIPDNSSSKFPAATLPDFNPTCNLTLLGGYTKSIVLGISTQTFHI